MSQQGIIFNIQRFTIHDGPGIRTELFLKGCPLRCEWCSNPESWMAYIQPGVYKTKCISRKKCDLCEEACPEKDILNFTRGKLTSINRSKCTNCLACYNACPSDAIKQWGKSMSVEECMKEILKDKGYYERSGGGVTVSGGEPLLQSDFAAELFKVCKDEEIQTCCESTFYADWKEIEKILPYTDIIISDIKHMDTNIHKKYIGVHNDRILENLKRLTSEKRELILRIPIIPNVNDNMDNMEATADFIIHELGSRVRTLQLLSFMRLGEEKYCSLGIPYKMEDVKVNRKSFQKHVNELANYFNSRGIHCLVGTKEKQ
ncbi:MAG: glycyl-radical enzyme activating protein [Clostridium sp.]|uniref:(2S)-3-sulfopropanediol dehydratase activating enzyme n=1 Tax=Clostridium sp. TaxID=1506 RepID=UPI0025C1F06D|nr:glycyl-radical enzyme activating protein [Clostridium sp.]MCH3964510.1 glycyl-radical enzyme activating protein [Clostridium sp.]MCI1714982.1 glycyl-radical enzyme activating protein [Clostridium sp.]MCI1799244.1 glycyl-radical enzyme activating protein [Clostridium sp.]MCI1813165.1 glycyl-radical enzyme activating protein [Clostridium sp.]MCI1870055.1 glycyl-radical enzyme activating protein [Clostridium sp.]